MDTKALARSKRAHTQQLNRKHHPSSQKPKTPSQASGGSGIAANKALGKQAVGVKSQSRRKSNLPSNWDRYEEDEEGKDPREVLVNSKTEVSDVPAPKSKGADYGHLITEARAQSYSLSDPNFDGFSSLDDGLPEFISEAASSLLSVRGEAILSWSGDDDFIVDDTETSSHEVSFLSLNLNALAEQLATVDLAKRLFIEPDLLPPEMHTEPSTASRDEASELNRSRKTNADKSHLHALDANDTVREETEEEYEEALASASNKDWGSQPDKIIAVQSTGQPTRDPALDTKNKISTFKAAAAEAELDALLDSFGETSLTDSSNIGFPKSAPSFQQHGSKSLLQPISKDSSEAGPVSHIANVDALLDDLLEEASNSVNQRAPPGLLQPQQVNKSVPAIQQHSSKSLLQHSRSEGLSSSPVGPASNSANIDTLLDDLLKETSNSGTQHGPHGLLPTQHINPGVNSIQTSATVTRSKVLDDFDSWLDTI